MKKVYLLYYANANRMAKDINPHTMLFSTDNLDDLNKAILRYFKTWLNCGEEYQQENIDLCNKYTPYEAVKNCYTNELYVEEITLNEWLDDLYTF